MNYKFYTGVGSRKTPVNILKLMQSLSEQLCTNNWILRSGGAVGADSAFEKGVLEIRKLISIKTLESRYNVKITNS